MSLLSAQLVTASLLAGLIIYVQWVAYPLFRHVPADAWPEYHRQHVRRVSPLAQSLVALDLLLAGLLLWTQGGPVTGLNLALAVLGLALTLLWHVPAHERLADRWSPGDVDRLIAANRVRTVAWCSRPLLLAILAP